MATQQAKHYIKEISDAIIDQSIEVTKQHVLIIQKSLNLLGQFQNQYQYSLFDFFPCNFEESRQKLEFQSPLLNQLFSLISHKNWATGDFVLYINQFKKFVTQQFNEILQDLYQNVKRFCIYNLSLLIGLPPSITKESEIIGQLTFYFNEQFAQQNLDSIKIPPLLYFDQEHMPLLKLFLLQFFGCQINTSIQILKYFGDNFVKSRSIVEYFDNVPRKIRNKLPPSFKSARYKDLSNSNKLFIQQVQKSIQDADDEQERSQLFCQMSQITASRNENSIKNSPQAEQPLLLSIINVNKEQLTDQNMPANLQGRARLISKCISGKISDSLNPTHYQISKVLGQTTQIPIFRCFKIEFQKYVESSIGTSALERQIADLFLGYYNQKQLLIGLKKLRQTLLGDCIDEGQNLLELCQIQNWEKQVLVASLSLDSSLLECNCLDEEDVRLSVIRVAEKFQQLYDIVVIKRDDFYQDSKSKNVKFSDYLQQIMEQRVRQFTYLKIFPSKMSAELFNQYLLSQMLQFYRIPEYVFRNTAFVDNQLISAIQRPANLIFNDSQLVDGIFGRIKKLCNHENSYKPFVTYEPESRIRITSPKLQSSIEAFVDDIKCLKEKVFNKQDLRKKINDQFYDFKKKQYNSLPLQRQLAQLSEEKIMWHFQQAKQMKVSYNEYLEWRFAAAKL